MRELGQLFKALSDETRLTIMGLVFEHGQLCVCEVEQLLGITQSKASRHLRYLRDAGALEDERDGLIVNYRLPRASDPERSAVLMLLRGMLAGRAMPEARSRLVEIRAARGPGRLNGTPELAGARV